MNVMAEVDDIGILYGKVNGLTTDVASIKTELPYLKDILERNTKANEKLADTLQEVQTSMIRMNEKMDNQSDAIVAMREEFEEASRHTNDKIDEVESRTSKKIKDVNNRVNEVEEKGKFDIHLFLKHNWGWIMTIIGIGMLYAAQFVKF